MATKSKRFRIAVEGATTDGRVISRDWILQMAKNYNPSMYGARVNMEHIKGYAPDSTFRRFGDVTAVDAEEITDGPLAGKLALYGVIDPIPELVELTKARQKIYTSIEVNPKFADTDEAYLVGLAVTDDPASLGTEMLQFSARASANPLASRKQDKDNLFTAAEETLIEFEEVADPAPSLMTRVAAIFSARKKADQVIQADVSEAITTVAERVQQVDDAISAQFSTLQTDLTGKLSQLEQQAEADRQTVADLTQKLSRTDSGQNTRPRSDGGDGNQMIQTDC